MDIFEFSDYKKYVQKWVLEQPSKGRGQWARIAESCQVSTVLVSQIFKGDKNLSQEQALRLCYYIKLDRRERDYFLLLVQKDRAGDHILAEYYQEKIQQIKVESLDLKNRLKQDKQLSEEAKAIFYSDWVYSAVRLLCGIDGIDHLSDLQSRLNIENKKLEMVVEFLVQEGLVVQQQGKLKSGPQSTHLGKESPLIKSRQISWRLKAIEAMDSPSEEQLFFTAPLTIAKKDLPVLKKVLLKSIDEAVKVIKTSEAEELVCLNIDLTPIQ